MRTPAASAPLGAPPIDHCGRRAVAAGVGLVLLSAAAAQPFATLVGGHLGLSRGDPLLPDIQDLLVGDVDGDGAPDLVALGAYTSVVCRNDRAGGLVVAQRLLGGFDRLRCGALVDLDGDGDLDLLAGEGSNLPSQTVGGPIRQFRNQGGVFAEVTAQRMPAVRWNNSALVVFDHDRDGDLDLAVTEGFFGPQILDNDGSGTFAVATAARLPAGLPAIETTLLRAVDLDRDGDVDLVASDAWSGFACLYLRNDGSGRFVLDTATIPGGDLVRGVVDVDGDGDHDLVRRTTLLVNDGSGSFTARPLGATVEAGAVIAADLDGEGHIDLLGAPFLRGTLPEVFCGRADGTFQAAALLPAELIAEEALRPPEFWTGAACLAVLDVDGDGWRDVVTAGWEAHRLGGSWTVGLPPKLLLNRAGRALVDGSRRTLPYQRCAGLGILGGDFGRGMPDLIVAGRGCTNRGDGSFAASAGAVTGDPVGSALADFDGDGDRDLVTTSASWRYWIAGPVLLQLRENGTWRTAPLPVNDHDVAAVAACDVDRDGDPDLVLGRFGNNGAANRLLRNDGRAGFTDVTAGRLPAFPESTSHVLARDVERDGDLDLIALVHDAAGLPAVRVLRNDGSGVFASAGTFPLPFARTLAAEDVDRDGDVDVVTPGTTLINDGTGSFSTQANSFPPFAHLVDLDGTWTTVSGELGRVVIGSEIHSWCWSQDHVTFPLDVDLDGDLDVAVASVVDPHRPYQFGMIQGVLFNLRRQLFAPRLARLGLPWVLEVQASEGNATASVVLGVAELVPRVSLPPFGLFGVDPAAAVVLPLVRAGMAPQPHSIVIPVPRDPGLLGLPLFAQALLVPGTGVLQDARLTGVVRDRIAR